MPEKVAKPKGKEAAANQEIDALLDFHNWRALRNKVLKGDFSFEETKYAVEALAEKERFDELEAIALNSEDQQVAECIIDKLLECNKGEEIIKIASRADSETVKEYALPKVTQEHVSQLPAKREWWARDRIARLSRIADSDLAAFCLEVLVDAGDPEYIQQFAINTKNPELAKRAVDLLFDSSEWYSIASVGAYNNNQEVQDYCKEKIELIGVKEVDAAFSQKKKKSLVWLIGSTNDAGLRAHSRSKLAELGITPDFVREIADEDYAWKALPFLLNELSKEGWGQVANFVSQVKPGEPKKEVEEKFLDSVREYGEDWAQAFIENAFKHTKYIDAFFKECAQEPEVIFSPTYLEYLLFYSENNISFPDGLSASEKPFSGELSDKLLSSYSGFSKHAVLFRAYDWVRNGSESSRQELENLLLNIYGEEEAQVLLAKARGAFITTEQIFKKVLESGNEENLPHAEKLRKELRQQIIFSVLKKPLYAAREVLKNPVSPDELKRLRAKLEYSSREEFQDVGEKISAFYVFPFSRKIDWKLEGPFYLFVAAGLSKSSLSELLECVTDRSDGELTPEMVKVRAEGVLSNMLMDEVFKQFGGDYYRPVIELVANGIDARPEGQKDRHLVNVRCHDEKLTVEDWGTGMTAEELFTDLIVPFKSSKFSLRDVGRFGVGFLSNISYCFSDSALLELESGVKGSSLKFSFSSFSPTEKDVKSIQLSCGEGLKYTGTKATLRKDGSWNEQLVERAMRHYLHWVDPERVVVNYNGEQVNKPIEGSVVLRAGQEFTVEVGEAGKAREEKVKQEVRIGVLPLGQQLGRDYCSPGIYFYSQGVLVNHVPVSNADCVLRVDMPSAIDLIEGRDDYLRDANWRKGMEATYKELYSFMSLNRANPELRKSFLHLLPELEKFAEVSMDEVMLTKPLDWGLAGLEERIAELANLEDMSLLPEYLRLKKEYERRLREPREREGVTVFKGFEEVLVGNSFLVSNERKHIFYHSFFGDAFDFMLVPWWVLNRWGEPDEMPDPGYYDLVSDDGKTSVFTEKIHEVGKNLSNKDFTPVFIEVEGNGVSPFFPQDDVVYVNVNHPFFHEGGYNALSQFVQYYCLALTPQGENLKTSLKTVEDILIRVGMR